MSNQLATMPTMHSERKSHQSASQLMQLSDLTSRQQEIVHEFRAELASQLRDKREEDRNASVQELRAIEDPVAKITQTLERIPQRPQEIAKAFGFLGNLSKLRTLAERNKCLEFERALNEKGFESDLQFLRKRDPRSDGYIPAAKKTLTRIKTRELKKVGNIHQYGVAIGQLQEYIRWCDTEKKLIPENGEVRLAAQRILLLGSLTAEQAEDFDAMKAVYDEYIYDGPATSESIATLEDFISNIIAKTRPPYLGDERIEMTRESLARLQAALEKSEEADLPPTTNDKPTPENTSEKSSNPYKNFGQKLVKTLKNHRFPIEVADVLTPDKIVSVREEVVEAVHYKHIADELLGFFPEVFALAVEDGERFTKYMEALLTNREAMYGDVIYKRFNPSTYEPSVLLTEK